MGARTAQDVRKGMPAQRWWHLLCSPPVCCIGPNHTAYTTESIKVITWIQIHLDKCQIPELESTALFFWFHYVWKELSEMRIWSGNLARIWALASVFYGLFLRVPLAHSKEIHVSVHSWRKKTFLNVVSLRGVSFLPNMGRSDSDSSDQMGSLAQPDPSPQSCVPLSLCYRDKGCSCLFIFSSNQSQSCRGGAQSPGCSRWGAVRTKNDYYSNTALHETRSKWMAQSAPRRKRQQLFCRDHFESALMNDRKTDSQLKSLWIYRDIG